MEKQKFSVNIPKTKLKYCKPIRNKTRKKAKKEAYTPELVLNHIEAHRVYVLPFRGTHSYDHDREVIRNG